jgi:hypothetical protein
VNPLTLGGERYLVAPRGETEWVRNIRVSRAGRLTFGGSTETVRVEEVADRDKAPILRAYLNVWALEVGDSSVESAPMHRTRSWFGSRRTIRSFGLFDTFVVHDAGRCDPRKGNRR